MNSIGSKDTFLYNHCFITIPFPVLDTCLNHFHVCQFETEKSESKHALHYFALKYGWFSKGLLALKDAVTSNLACKHPSFECLEPLEFLHWAFSGDWLRPKRTMLLSLFRFIWIRLMLSSEKEKTVRSWLFWTSTMSYASSGSFNIMVTTKASPVDSQDSV